MQRKRVVLISSVAIMITICLVPSISIINSNIVEGSSPASIAQDSFTINYPSEPFTWCKDSKVNLIIWTITNTTLNRITFDILRNGTAEYSGSSEYSSLLQYIPVFYKVPISVMDLGTYNYTLVTTDTVEVKSATIILNLVEGTARPANPMLYALVFPALIGGFAIIYLIIFRFPSLNRYFGGMKSIEP